MKKLKIAGFILAAIQLILSIAVICDISETKMVPPRYIILLGVLLFVVFLIAVFFSKKKKKAFKICAIVISAVMCILLCVAMYYLRITNKTIDEVIGVKTEVDEINVYVSKDGFLLNSTTIKSFRSNTYGELSWREPNTPLSYWRIPSTRYIA